MSTRKPVAVITPTVHLNGTDAQELAEQALGVLNALRETYEAMRRATPHARDYYVQDNGDAAILNAHNEHSLRLKAINELMDVYTSELIQLHQQTRGGGFGQD